MKKLLLLVLFISLSLPVWANCGNGNSNGNGEGCEPNGGGNGGQQGQPGTNGNNGNNGSNGTNGTNGANGINGTNGTNAVETPKRAFQGELDLRLWDTRYTSVYLFDSYGFDDSPGHDFIMNGRNGTYGFKFVVKLGTDYTTKLIENQSKIIKELESRLNKLESENAR